MPLYQLLVYKRYVQSPPRTITPSGEFKVEKEGTFEIEFQGMGVRKRWRLTQGRALN